MLCPLSLSVDKMQSHKNPTFNIQRRMDDPKESQIPMTKPTLQTPKVNYQPIPIDWPRQKGQESDHQDLTSPHQKSSKNLSL